MMSWKRKIFEPVLWLAGQLVSRADDIPVRPKTIFLFQPSHIGDILVDTPLFDALHRRFPKTRLVVGCGKWNFATLKGNPNIAELLPLSVPWNNTFVRPQGFLPAARFIFSSPQSRALRGRHFEIGIDLIGTQLDSLLLIRAGIPHRFGINGAGGGYSAFRKWVPYDDQQPMARTALRLAEALGAKDLPPIEPQIFLTDAERCEGRRVWEESWGRADSRARHKRVIIGPAASFVHKCWPMESYRTLVTKMLARGDVDVALVGGNDAVEACAALAAIAPDRVRNFAVKMPLREVFALVAAADCVVCNSNMLMHVAAAFSVPAVVVLSNSYLSASQHKMQWGYPSTRVLGREPMRPQIYSADEAFGVIEQVLAPGAAT